MAGVVVMDEEVAGVVKDGVIVKDNPVMVAPGLEVSHILVVVAGLVEEVDLILQIVQLLDVLQVNNKYTANSLYITVYIMKS